MNNLGANLDYARSGKGRSVSDAFIEKRSQRKEITASVHSFTSGLFRREIEWRSDNNVTLRTSEAPLRSKISAGLNFFEMFDEVVRATMGAQQNLRQTSLQEAIRPITKLDYTGRGKLTKKEYVELMQAAFRQSIAVSADML